MLWGGLESHFSLRLRPLRSVPFRSVPNRRQSLMTFRSHERWQIWFRPSLTHLSGTNPPCLWKFNLWLISWKTTCNSLGFICWKIPLAATILSMLFPSLLQTNTWQLLKTNLDCVTKPWFQNPPWWGLRELLPPLEPFTVAHGSKVLLPLPGLCCSWHENILKVNLQTRRRCFFCCLRAIKVADRAFQSAEQVKRRTS